MIKGWDLDFFSSKEWKVCDERLKDLEKINRPVVDGYNPGRAHLFEALRCTPFEKVRVCLVGQDPYPSRKYATGLAFSIPDGIGSGDWPPTLRTFLAEYSSDLHQPCPSSGNLRKWGEAGVLLWNAIPSCRTGYSLSHDWPEWDSLTREIISKLAKKGIVYVFLGKVASRYSGLVSLTNNRVVCTSHPSPRASRASKSPFVGSRVFSTVNQYLNDIALEPIDWRLP